VLVVGFVVWNVGGRVRCVCKIWVCERCVLCVCVSDVCSCEMFVVCVSGVGLCEMCVCVAMVVWFPFCEDECGGVAGVVCECVVGLC